MSMSKEAREAKNAYNRAWYKKNNEHAREQSRIRQARYWERKAAAARIDENPGAATDAESEPAAE